MRYNSANYGGGAYFFNENNFNCGSGSEAGSVRSVGHGTDTSISTIALFGETNLEGDMSQYSTDVPEYAGKFSSVVITPPGEATFYIQNNYGGLSICLRPQSGYESHWTWDLLNEHGIEPGEIKSMKFGCHSSNIHYSSPASTSVVKQ